MSDDLKNLEHDTERARNNVSDLLDELRLRVSPGEMVDQIVGYAGDGAGEMVRNLGSQVRNNPLPALLVGVGVAWLMLGDRTPRLGASGSRAARRGVDRIFGKVEGAVSSVRHTAEPTASRIDGTGERLGSRAAHLRATAADRFGEARERLDETAHELGGRAQTLADDAASTASGLYDTSSETAHDALSRARSLGDEAASRATSMYETASDRAARATQDTVERARMLAHDAGAAGQRAMERARHAGGSAADKGQRLAADMGAFLKDQPLVAAGLGLAVGALIGALLPASEAENKLMGETSDGLKRRAREAAGEQYDSAKQAVREAADEAYGTVVGTVAEEEAGRQGEPTQGEDTTELHARR